LNSPHCMCAQHCSSFTFCILKHVLYRLHIDDYAEPHWNWKCLCVIPESLCYVYSMLHCIFASCSSCSWSLITDQPTLSLIFFLSPELPLYLFVNPLWSNWPLLALFCFLLFVNLHCRTTIDWYVGSLNHLAFAGLCADEGLLGWIAMVQCIIYSMEWLVFVIFSSLHWRSRLVIGR